MISLCVIKTIHNYDYYHLLNNVVRRISHSDLVYVECVWIHLHVIVFNFVLFFKLKEKKNSYGNNYYKPELIGNISVQLQAAPV